ncbi:helix-turn-helix transcriptional regulator [Corynebacterium freiburgense]|uniref:helix-turn-helix transcriptional regulator n=1 Tax=Corynebacterium freiburgense TaxID=556548 RepID=UPI0004037BC2|nr:helix-turn-helix transcriptional regulator [Corynebacterium freiburgense]WJZ03229.1 DNA-binding transcriptional regulator SoxS [Corynebacterium freiburgense]
MDLAGIQGRISTSLRSGHAPTLRELAAQYGYSPWYLSRRFKALTGYSLRQYIEALKIHRGIEQLTDYGMSVSESALNCGYASLGTYSNTFIQHTGISPSQHTAKSRKALNILTKIRHRKGTFYHYEQPLTTAHTITVNATYPHGYDPCITCIGLFPSAIPKGPPIVGAALFNHTTTKLLNIPNGEFYLLACDLPLLRTYTQLIKTNYRQMHPEKLRFPQDSGRDFTLAMRPPIPEDPPITFNLPVLISQRIQARIQERKSQ